MKFKNLLIIATLALSACQGASTSAEPGDNQSIAPAPTYGAYMLVMGKNYQAKDLGAYAQALPSIYAKYGGEYVSFATDVDVAEGTYQYQSLIMSGWPSESAARKFWDSPEYAEARKLRDGIGEFDVIIVPALTAKTGQ